MPDNRTTTGMRRSAAHRVDFFFIKDFVFILRFQENITIGERIISESCSSQMRIRPESSIEYATAVRIVFIGSESFSLLR